MMMEMKEEILQEIKALGFEPIEIQDIGYLFECGDAHILYIPSEDDDDYLRFAIPNIYDVTEENSSFLLEIVNDANLELKYVKANMMGDYTLWLFFEHKRSVEEPLDDILEFMIRTLEYSRKHVLQNIYGELHDGTFDEADLITD